MTDPHSTDEESGPKAAEEHPAGPVDEALRTINSAELLQGARAVLIQHDEKVYRLQVTRNGKLILVK